MKLCPRCVTNEVEVGSRGPLFLGTKAEGPICGDCWLDDRPTKKSPSTLADLIFELQTNK